MSYNYEITHDVMKKKTSKETTNYLSSDMTHNPEFQSFIFELILKNENGKQKTIRKIKKSNQGTIISSNDNILYKSIKKFKLSVVQINCSFPDSDAQESFVPTIIKEYIDHDLTYTTFIYVFQKNKNIYIEIKQSDKGNIEFSYHINFNLYN